MKISDLYKSIKTLNILGTSILIKLSFSLFGFNLQNQKKILIITKHFPPESVGRSSRINGMVEFLKKNSQ